MGSADTMLISALDVPRHPGCPGRGDIDSSTLQRIERWMAEGAKR